MCRRSAAHPDAKFARNVAEIERKYRAFISSGGVRAPFAPPVLAEQRRCWARLSRASHGESGRAIHRGKDAGDVRRAIDHRARAYCAAPRMNDSARLATEAMLRRMLDEFRGRLHAIVRQRCPRELGIAPDDVEQEVRIRLWRTLAGEKVIDHPASYLHKTVLSVIVDLVRRRAARPDISMAQDIDDAVADGALTHEAGDPLAQTERQSFAQAVLAAVASLPERRRRPVQLHLQGFTTAQVGTLIGVTEPAARNLVYRGLEELRERLQQEGWGHDL
jgi:RNA polymerase sigma factor (sigma-70 family)